MDIQNSLLPGKTKDDFDVGRRTVTIYAASIAAMVTPRGVQQVSEVNRQRPEVHVHVGDVNITCITDLALGASSAASQLGAKVKAVVSATHTY